MTGGTEAGRASGGTSPSQQRGGSVEVPPNARLANFLDALADDFNTPRAMAQVFELIGDANRSEVPGAPEAISEMLQLVGLGTLTQPDESGESDERALELLEERQVARAAKDFERADQIRDELAELGWEVRDSAEGPRLVPKT